MSATPPRLHRRSDVRLRLVRARRGMRELRDQLALASERERLMSTGA